MQVVEHKDRVDFFFFFALFAPACALSHAKYLTLSLMMSLSLNWRHRDFVDGPLSR